MEPMTLYQGSPRDLADRLARETRVYTLLERLAIPFSHVDHAPAMTMADCEAIDGMLGVSMCKNLFLCNRQQTDFYLLMMPADKPFRTKELSEQIGSSRLSFAQEDHLLRLLDIQPGAVSVMGLMNDAEGCVRLLIDEEIAQSEWLGCHPCVNTTSLKIATRDILTRFLPAVRHTYQIVRLSGRDPVSV